MKRTLTLVQQIRGSALTAAVMLGIWAGSHPAVANSESFSAMPAFGDSLTDTGNFFRLSGGYPPPPAYEGRFCDGPLWVEYLASDLGLTYNAEDNYAVAGATTGTVNYNDRPGVEFPGLLEEVDSFLSGGGTSEPERALYLVGAGANDFFRGLGKESPQSIIANGVNNTLVAVQRLSASGARYIMVMNLPDLGVTPFALSSGNGASLRQLSAAYNQVLDLALDHLAEAGIPTLRLDAFAVLDRMATQPADYGFSNVVIPLTVAPAGADPAQFLFWDGVHPTTKAHRVLAAEALHQILDHFSPSQGKGDPESKRNSLHGLVNADVQHR